MLEFVSQRRGGTRVVQSKEREALAISKKDSLYNNGDTKGKRRPQERYGRNEVRELSAQDGVHRKEQVLPKWARIKALRGGGACQSVQNQNLGNRRLCRHVGAGRLRGRPNQKREGGVGRW